MSYRRRRNTAAVLVPMPTGSSSVSFASVPVDTLLTVDPSLSSTALSPLNHHHYNRQQQPQLSPSTTTLGATPTNTAPSFQRITTPTTSNTTTTQSTSFTFRHSMPRYHHYQRYQQQQQQQPQQKLKSHSNTNNHNSNNRATTTTNILHQLGLVPPQSWKPTTRNIPYYIFHLGLWSILTLLLLNMVSFILLFYMTHIQNIRPDNHDGQMWMPFWWLPSTDDAWGFDSHRRINTLLRSTSSSSSSSKAASSADHVYPTTVQLEHLSTLNINSYRHRDYYVQRPKQQHRLNWEARINQNRPDYGNIRRIPIPAQLHPSNRTMPRLILPNDYELYEAYRTDIIDRIDVPEMSYYYHQYDDLDFSALNPHSSDGSTQKIPYNEEENPASCERPTWGYDNSKINCNVIHELHPPLLDGLIQNSIQPLGHGYYRDTYLIKHQNVDNIASTPSEDHIVMKQLRYEHPQTRQYQYEMNLEAMIMEITTASTATSYIYGHCSTTLLVESLQDVTNTIVPYQKQYQPIRGRVSDEILHSLEAEQAEKLNMNSTSEPYSFNTLTVYEKLQYAMQMSQALVEMHGYVGGVIVHDDVHPDQWLISHDKKRLVLNDMNNAVILLWSRQYNKYCTFWDQYGGDYRAPEMYQEDGTYTTDEQADVYPMGNLIYSLITGLFPHHNVTDNDEIKIQKLTMNPNAHPYIHPKLRQFDDINATHIHTDAQMELYIYQRLIYIMDQCHHMAPHDRPYIFAVYQYLTETQTVVDAHSSKINHDVLTLS